MPHICKSCTLLVRVATLQSTLNSQTLPAQPALCLRTKQHHRHKHKYIIFTSNRYDESIVRYDSYVLEQITTRVYLMQTEITVKLCLFCITHYNTPQKTTHFLRLSSFLFPDQLQIPWQLQVFQLGGHPDQCIQVVNRLAATYNGLSATHSRRWQEQRCTLRQRSNFRR